jgi:hypothetical protein
MKTTSQSWHDPLLRSIFMFGFLFGFILRSTGDSRPWGAGMMSTPILFYGNS